MKALKLLMKDCERGILSGTFEPTLDWAKEVLEVYNKEDSEVFERLVNLRFSLRDDLKEIQYCVDSALDRLDMLED